MNILSLPEEILLLSFTFLDSCKDVCHIKATCTLFNSIANSNCIWKLLYTLRWPNAVVLERAGLDWRQEFFERCEKWREWPAMFNTKPELGIRFLIEEGKLHSASDRSKTDKPLEFDPKEMASFLLDEDKEAKKLKRQTIANFLSDTNNRTNGLVEAYAEFFHLEDKSIDIALREFFSSMELPGESQIVQILVGGFSRTYYKINQHSNKLIFPAESEDAVFLLAYAVIMLSSDLHSHCKKKMAVNDWIKIVLNNNEYLRCNPDPLKEQQMRKYLENVYVNIKKESLKPMRQDATNNNVPNQPRTFWQTLTSYWPFSSS